MCVGTAIGLQSISLLPAPRHPPFVSPPGSFATSDNHSEVDSQLQDIMLSQSSCGHPFEENLMDKENLMSSKLISPLFDSALYRDYYVYVYY